MKTTDASSLRELLYRVIRHYDELAAAARKGEVDPIGYVGRIVRRRFPYLLLVIRDILPLLERNQLDYYEALFKIIRESQSFGDFQTVLDSKAEIERIEEGRRVFGYALKWIDSEENRRPGEGELREIQEQLGTINEKCVKYYLPREDGPRMILASEVSSETGSADLAFRRLAELMRSAIQQIFHMTAGSSPRRSVVSLFTRPARDLDKSLRRLAWFLFRCGYSVDWVASGYYRDSISALLNEEILDRLIRSRKNLTEPEGLSIHLALISLIDFSNFFDMPSDYCDIEDGREISRHARFLNGKGKRGGTLLKKVYRLYKYYKSNRLASQAEHYLAYRYYSSFGSYHGDRRSSNAMASVAVEVYKDWVDREAVEELSKREIAESGPAYSSKTKEEMAALMKLFADSLENPGSIHGDEVKILGDISSGGMGKVSIGIHSDMIVALKTVIAEQSGSPGYKAGLLSYEGAIHSRVQTSDERPGQVLPPDRQHPYIVEYHGLVEQDNQLVLIIGYYPNDSLTHLVKQNREVAYDPSSPGSSKITLRTFRVVVDQLLECLRHFQRRQVVHRDLKTDNILFTVDENENINRIKIIDFGTGLAMGPGAEPDFFKGKLVGTPLFMAPEQAKGRSSYESDLYSVGAVLTVLLTGRAPIRARVAKTREDMARLVHKVRSQPRPPLTDLNPFLKISPGFLRMASIVSGMLNINPLERPTVDQCRQAFDRAFDAFAEDLGSVGIFYTHD
jgi:serine/threonine-protein kinase